MHDLALVLVPGLDQDSAWDTCAEEILPDCSLTWGHILVPGTDTVLNRISSSHHQKSSSTIVKISTQKQPTPTKGSTPLKQTKSTKSPKTLQLKTNEPQQHTRSEQEDLKSDPPPKQPSPAMLTLRSSCAAPVAYQLFANTSSESEAEQPDDVQARSLLYCWTGPLSWPSLTTHPMLGCTSDP